jgi:hypothetical protein
MDLKEISCEAVAQDSDRWRALVVAVMNLRIPIKGEEFLHHMSDYHLFKKDPLPMSYVELAP